MQKLMSEALQFWADDIEPVYFSKTEIGEYIVEFQREIRVCVGWRYGGAAHCVCRKYDSRRHEIMW
jgi:hypothetical protein